VLEVDQPVFSPPYVVFSVSLSAPELSSFVLYALSTAYPNVLNTSQSYTLEAGTPVKISALNTQNDLPPTALQPIRLTANDLVNVTQVQLSVVDACGLSPPDSDLSIQLEFTLVIKRHLYFLFFDLLQILFN
jgi:hypothetical protein